MNLPRNVDYSYIFSHCDRTKFEIPHYYDRETWKIGETYRMRISNIYDPSKFWIVLKENELNIFQEFISHFYKKNGNSYKMFSDTVSRNMYCVVFTENAFFRGLIVNIPHGLTLQKKAVVFLFDFGYMCTISLEHLYYLAEKFYEVPQFAVRASLSYVQPYSKYTWNYDVIKRFNELVTSKVLLCIVECTDRRRKIVEIRIGSVDEFSSITDIGNILISEKLAKSLSTKKESINEVVKDNSRYIPKTKYPYLFPSFEAIEGGIVPWSVYTSEMLKHCVARDVLFKPYFSYKGTSEN